MFRMHGQFLFNLGSDNDYLAVHFEDKSKQVGRIWDLVYDLSQQGLNIRILYFSLNPMVRPDSEVIVAHRYELVQKKSLGYKPQEIGMGSLPEGSAITHTELCALFEAEDHLPTKTCTLVFDSKVIPANEANSVTIRPLYPKLYTSVNVVVYKGDCVELQ